MNMREAATNPTSDIRRGVMRLARRLRSERPVGSLSVNKLSVLGTLGRLGPLTAGAVAEVERQRPQSLTRVFAELEIEGLITRARSERDRRESVLTITESGRRAVATDIAHRDAWLDEALTTLTDTEVQLVALAADIMERLATDRGARRRAA